MDDLFPHSGMDYFNIDMAPNDIEQLNAAAGESGVAGDLAMNAIQSYHENFTTG